MGSVIGRVTGSDLLLLGTSRRRRGGADTRRIALWWIYLPGRKVRTLFRCHPWSVLRLPGCTHTQNTVDVIMYSVWQIEIRRHMGEGGEERKCY